MTRAKKRKLDEMRTRLRGLWETEVRRDKTGAYVSWEYPVYDRDEINRATPADLKAMWARRPR